VNHSIMANATHRLHLFQYEAEPDWGKYLNREEGPDLDDEQVARLLLGARLRTQRDSDREPAVAIEAAAESDALTAMRGVMVGLAWVVPVWALIGAIFLLA